MPTDPILHVRERLAGYSPGRGLEGDFYSDPAIYEADLRLVWRCGWLFAAHSCQIAKPGQYVTLPVDKDSILLIRGDDGAVHAMHNVCRHRGTLICSESSGSAGKLVCPYHQWTYDKSGKLLAARGMQQDIDKSQLGLKRVAAEECGGLIFINLAPNPSDFSAARAALEPLLLPQGLARARVARIVEYEVAANWKLVWENNRECYHCNINHPQYIRANFDHYNSDDTNEQVRADLARQTARSEAKWASLGLSVTHKETGMTLFPDAERNIWFSANRTPLADGYLSETMDGRQKAPLMGAYKEPDVGTLRVRALPNFWNHSSCDHAVSTRLLPAGPRKTLVQVAWLVDQQAEEGVHYRVEDIMPFWQLTSEQDWSICESVQKGVESSSFEPGPYSKFKEYNVDGFVKWYAAMMGKR